jgi:hypothetical protein
MQESKPLWETAKKPWSREICRLRYVQSVYKIGYKPLSIEAEVSYGTLKGWAIADSEDPENRSWPEQRKQFQHELRNSTHEKTLERVSDAIADNNVDLVKLHLEAWEDQRDNAAEFNKALKQHIKCLRKNEQVPEGDFNVFKLLLKLGGKAPVTAYASSLSSAIQGERIAASLDIVRVEVLEREANKHGLSLVDMSALPGLGLME